MLGKAVFTIECHVSGLHRKQLCDHSDLEPLCGFCISFPLPTASWVNLADPSLHFSAEKNLYAGLPR